MDQRKKKKILLPGSFIFTCNTPRQKPAKTRFDSRNAGTLPEIRKGCNHLETILTAEAFLSPFGSVIYRLTCLIVSLPADCCQSTCFTPDGVAASPVLCLPTVTWYQMVPDSTYKSVSCTFAHPHEECAFQYL